MSGRVLVILCFTGAVSVLACDRAPESEDPMTATTIVVTGPDSAERIATPVARTADRAIAGPVAQDGKLGMAPQVDPMLTLFEPVGAHTVTLAPVIGSAGSKRWVAPSMDLFGSAAQPWRVQVGPRTDLGRKSGLMLRGGTEGQHNRWDLGASATVGERSNVQGIIRYHP